MKKILFTLAIIASTALSYGQGTIAFNNGTLTRATLDGVNVAVGAPINFGVFYGTSAGSLSLSAVLGQVTTTAGIFAASNGSGSLYQLAGTTGGQTGVFLQFRAWSSSFGSDWAAAQAAYDAGTAGTVWGQTAVVQTDLGQTAGPATVIWQTSSGTAANRFTPIQVFSAVPEPSTYALGALGIGALLMVRRRKA